MNIAYTLSWAFKWDGVSKDFDVEVNRLKLALLNAGIDFHEAHHIEGKGWFWYSDEDFVDLVRDGDAVGVDESELKV